MIEGARCIAATIVALAFGASAIAKARHPVQFARAVAGYNLLPERAAHGVAGLLIACEAIIAVCHVSGQRMPAAAYGAVGLLFGFAALALATLRSGHLRPCYCFDTAGRELTSWRSVARVALLAACEAVVLSGTADTLITPWDLWRARDPAGSINVIVLTTVAVVGGRCVIRLGDLVEAARACHRVSWRTGTAESRFRDWSTAEVDS